MVAKDSFLRKHSLCTQVIVHRGLRPRSGLLLCAMCRRLQRFCLVGFGTCGQFLTYFLLVHACAWGSVRLISHLHLCRMTFGHAIMGFYCLLGQKPLATKQAHVFYHYFFGLYVMNEWSRTLVLPTLKTKCISWNPLHVLTQVWYVNSGKGARKRCEPLRPVVGQSWAGGRAAAPLLHQSVSEGFATPR